MQNEVPFYDRLELDESGITIEYYDTIKDVRFLQEGNYVAMHQHDHYEIMLIRRGSCQYLFSDRSLPLIPGDILISPPGDRHSYRFHEAICFNTCQFTVEVAKSLNITGFLQEMKNLSSESELSRMQSALKRLEGQPYMQHRKEKTELQNTDKTELQNTDKTELQNTDGSRREKESRLVINKERQGKELEREIDMQRQGILHLSQEELMQIEALFDALLEEQDKKLPEYVRLKENLLVNLMIQMVRIKNRRFSFWKDTLDWQSQMIYDAVAEIEAHLDEDFDYKRYAEQYSVSQSHFRKLFKDITGLPPNEYVNRLRIVRSLELLENTRMPIARVAEAVGIRDQNYFSRLFRKIIGCSPSSYKSI